MRLQRDLREFIELLNSGSVDCWAERHPARQFFFHPRLLKNPRGSLPAVAAQNRRT